MQYDVFISYARKDYADEQTKEVIPGNIVSHIKQLLDDNGLTYWFDETGIYSGDQFAGVIADAIEQSSIFLYISTEASNASKWTINEIATAKHLDKKIIPFRYDSSKYNKSILMYLAPLDHIDYPKSKDKAFGQLMASIKTYKLTQERAEQEQQRAIELAKRREQEALEKQRQELEKQVRVREINQQLETLSSEIQKKKQEQASINIVLEGLEKRRTNLNNELAFLTGMATSYHPIEEEEEKVPDEDNAVTKEDESKKERSSVSFGDVWNKCISFASRNKMPLIVLLILGLLAVMLLLFWPNTSKYTAREMCLKADTLFHGYNGAQKDTLEAIKWYLKAAKQGYTQAQSSIGLCYYNGHGVEQDYTKAFKWFLKAAEQGEAVAQNHVGYSYKVGHGVMQDPFKAVEWYRKAAEQGQINAQCNLGNAYISGEGVIKNYDKAVEWYRKAAEREFVDAQYALGECYYYGYGVTKNHTKAVEWFCKAAKQGLPVAQYALGCAYYNGEGVALDYSKAFEWFGKAEKQGFVINQGLFSKAKAYTVNGVSFTMVAVKGGTFTMGASSSDSYAKSDEKPAHQVTLSSYSIGETEVTQELWQAVMGSNPSRFTGDLQRPVEWVSWDDCQEFIRKLNSLTGATFRLPTEAEWEYAARGGSQSRGYKYSGSDNLGTVAWYDGNSSSTTHPVKGKQPNELGLYDMSGNVWEWCADWYDSSYYSSSPSSNPKGPSASAYRVLRGGGWGDSNSARYCRVSYRGGNTPSFMNNVLGLRLVSQ